MLNLVPIFRVLGGMLVGFALIMLTPLAFAIDEATAGRSVFVMPALVTAFFGFALLALSPGGQSFELNRRQGFLLTAIAWVVIPAFAALPLVAYGLSYADAYFEAVSGLTTTGATVIAGLDQTPRDILFWRAMLNWVGGLGIIVVGIIMLPFLRVGGMQLFKTESSDTSEKIVSKTFDLAVWLLGVYVFLTALCMLVYAGVGMTWFDAAAHAMSSIATGGFSTHDASFGHFEGSGHLWAGAIFMAAGAMPFVAFIRLAKGGFRQFLGDIQIHALLGFLLLASFVIALTRAIRTDVDFVESFAHALFNVTSIVTTTGFASEDYQLWGSFAIGAFFILTFVGGCSGSTAGGIKIYRFQILARLAGAHLSRIISPNRVQVVLYHDRKVEDDVAFAILAFLVVMLFSLIISTFLLAWIGVDFVTALTGSATSLANVGPGLGDVIGPAGNFQPLPDAAKWILAAMMVLGRLEFFTFFVLLTPAFWRW